MSSGPRSVAVVTDSTSDLPAAEAEALKVEVVPALLTIEGQVYEDGRGLTRSEFYARLPQLRVPPTTAAPSPFAFEAAYSRALSTGVERVLSIHLSPKLSGMLNAASQAAKSFGNRIHLFDSGQVSLGLGFQVMEAASAALAGQPLGLVLDAARRARERVRTIAMIDTLEYLRRSGRVSWIRTSLGDMLRVKLLVEVTDGVVNRLGQVRTRRRALDRLVSMAKSWGALDRLAVVHSAVPEKAAAFAERIRHLSASPPLLQEVTTVIGAHVGPGSIGVVGLPI